MTYPLGTINVNSRFNENQDINLSDKKTARRKDLLQLSQSLITCE